MKIAYGQTKSHEPMVSFESAGAVDNGVMEKVYQAAVVPGYKCKIVRRKDCEHQRFFGVLLKDENFANFIGNLAKQPALLPIVAQVQAIWNAQGGPNLDLERREIIHKQRAAEKAAQSHTEQAITFMRERIGAAREVSRLNREAARTNPHLAFRAGLADIRDQVIIPAYQGEIRKLELNPQLNSVDIINALRRMFNNETGAMNTEILRNQGKIEVDEIDQFRINPARYVECNISRLAFA